MTSATIPGLDAAPTKHKGLLSWVQEVAELTQPGQPVQRIPLPRRSLSECLAEELRRLQPDPVFGEVLATVGRLCADRQVQPVPEAGYQLQGCMVVA